MASLSKTFSGDFTGFLAGKLWDEIKRRNEEEEIDKREGDPAVKKAAKILLRDDPKAISVKDPALRDRVSKLFGAGLDVKFVKLEDRVDKLSSTVSTIGASVSDINKLVVNQNEILEAKFDEILKIFGKEVELKKEEIEKSKTEREELELEEGVENFGSRALLSAARGTKKGGGGLLGFLMRRAGANVVRRLLRRFVPRRMRARGRIVRGLPGAFRRKITKAAIRRLPGSVGRKLSSVVLRETAEAASKRAVKRQLMKSGGKVAGKKIPGIGWIAGGIFAIERALKGDYEGASLEILSGLAGSIPTVGTATSLGIDAYIIQRDIERGQSYEGGTKNEFTKGGLSRLHGQEIRLTKTDREDTMEGFMNSLNTMGTMLVSIALTVAQSAGAEVDIQSQMKKEQLPFKVTNIPFKSDLGRIKSVSYELEDQTFSAPNMFSRKGSNPLVDPVGEEQEEEKVGPIKAMSNWVGSAWDSAFGDGLAPGVEKDAQYPNQPGVDFTPAGINNRAVFAGKVVQIGHQYDKNKLGGDGEQGSGYGNYVVVRSTDPTNGKQFDGLYAHFPTNDIRVSVGQDVKFGQILGRMGTKDDKREEVGSLTGPHTSLDLYEPDSWTQGYHNREKMFKLIDPTFTKDPSLIGKPSGGTDDFARGLIRSHEAASGAELTVYLDSEGYPTVGYGHLIDSGSPPDIRNLKVGDTITLERAESLFDEDYEFHKQAAMQIPGWENANARQRAALIDLTFNMGPSWHLGFPSMVKAMQANDWKEAARHLKFSDPDNKPGVLSPWMGQVGTRRSTPILSLISGGGIPKESTHLKHLKLPELEPPPEEKKESLLDILWKRFFPPQTKDQEVSYLNQNSADVEEIMNKINQPQSPIVVFNNQVVTSQPMFISSNKRSTSNWKLQYQMFSLVA